jgi:diadenosine tetraphosphatase ApaH/serine/threonine PP2A family protein phosphatase
MKYAIISDIHANLEALEAVLADAQPLADRFVCLGDIVGYNANPNECLHLIQSLCDVVIVGNHDQAAVGLRPYNDFNEYASAAIDWTREQLTPAGYDYLRGLPLTATFGTCWLAAHGSPRHTDEYLFQAAHFQQSFIYLQQHMPEVRCCFVGHTHLPMVWQCLPEGIVWSVEMESLTTALDMECRYIVNPGSVGQPRYGGPDASYVLLDDEALTVEFRFVPYDVETTQEKIYDAGLPSYLAERLAIGH